jgi:molecular chaperone DnaK
MENRHVIGIDFGTTNSYFCRFLGEAEGHKVRPVDFGNDQIGGLATVILYRDDRPPLIGALAEHEWGEATTQERNRYTLRTHFKPEIASSVHARKDAIQFFNSTTDLLTRRGLDYSPEKCCTILGMPAEADAHFQSSLRDVLKAAHYGDVQLVAEPVGALLYHLWNQDLSPRQAEAGVLVVDFGGGTLDFAFMKGVDVIRAWGDMLYGGRLFDDLFFQWFLAQNPGALKKLIRDRDEYIVHWSGCRRAKEHFSSLMRMNRTDSVHATVGELKFYGFFKNLTWKDFLKRAQNYTPHPLFLTYLEESHQHLGRLTDETNIDLLEWFREALVAGLKKNHIEPEEVGKILLTGGSSQWPFVDDIISSVFRLKGDREKLFLSENPKATVAEGLAILPHLQNKFAHSSKKLSDELIEFRNKQLEPEIDKRISQVAEHVSHEIMTQLVNVRLARVLLSFGQKGGSILQLKESIQAEVFSFGSALQDILHKELDLIARTLPAAVHERVCEWFGDNGMRYFGERIELKNVLPAVKSGGSGLFPDQVSSFNEHIVKSVANFNLKVLAGIVGVLTSGTGSVVALRGPLGWLIGTLVSFLVSSIVYVLEKKGLSGRIENVQLPSLVTRVVLSERRIERILRRVRSTSERSLTVEITKYVSEPAREMTDAIVGTIKKEIKSLTVINQI